MAARKTKPEGVKGDKIWTDALRLEANHIPKKGKEKQIRRLARKMFKEGINGSVPAAAEIGNRLAGRPPQAVEIAGTVDHVIEIIHVQLSRDRLPSGAPGDRAVDVTPKPAAIEGRKDSEKP